jgi:hypothetical protein
VTARTWRRRLSRGRCVCRRILGRIQGKRRMRPGHHSQAPTRRGIGRVPAINCGCLSSRNSDGTHQGLANVCSEPSNQPSTTVPGGGKFFDPGSEKRQLVGLRDSASVRVSYASMRFSMSSITVQGDESAEGRSEPPWTTSSSPPREGPPRARCSASLGLRGQATVGPPDQVPDPSANEHPVVTLSNAVW